MYTDFMTNGYASEVLEKIRNGRSRHTYLNPYDMMVVRSQVNALDGVELRGFLMKLTSVVGTFETMVHTTTQVPIGEMQFIGKYETTSELNYDGTEGSSGLITEEGDSIVF